MIIVPITLGGSLYFAHVSSSEGNRASSDEAALKAMLLSYNAYLPLAAWTKTRSDIFTLHFVGQTLTVKHILKGITGQRRWGGERLIASLPL